VNFYLGKKEAFMIRKLFILLMLVGFAAGSSGCLALLAGAGAGAGTSTWLAGKLVQEVDASFERTIAAAESGLNDLDLAITKKTVKDDVAQIIAEYSDGSMTWVDIHKVLDDTSRIEVRVGVRSDKQAARKILEQIQKRL
jgi:hypothetical protein